MPSLVAPLSSVNSCDQSCQSLPVTTAIRQSPNIAIFAEDAQTRERAGPLRAPCDGQKRFAYFAEIALDRIEADL